LATLDGRTAVKGGISAQEIGTLLQHTAATRQYLILDSCEAGAAIPQLAIRNRNFEAGQRLSRNIGIHVLAATGPAQREKELAGIAHSSLAEALLEGLGLNGAPRAQANSIGVITVEDLTSFVKLRNPQLVHRYGGTASQIMSSESGPDFAIAKRP
jgi:uncharacterized caspase-like protein